MIDISLGTAPISVDTPTGTDVTYESDFEELQVEVGKLYSPSTAGEVNWKKICRLATAILEFQSKDLVAASYLGVGLIHLEGIDGFERGLIVLNDLTRLYWDTFFPPLKKKKRRLGAVEWWCERGGNALGLLKPETVSKDKIQEITALLDEFTDLVNGKLSSTIPRHHIVTQLKRLEKAEVAPPQKPVIKPAIAKENYEKIPSTTPVPANSSMPAESSIASTSGKMVNQQDANRVFNESMGQLKKVAQVLRENDISNHLPYGISRFEAWIKVTDLPPAEGGKTQIPPPSMQEIDFINTLVKSQSWQNLINESEVQIGKYIFWLDLNRYTATALEGLGSKCFQALDLVCASTASFCSKLNGIQTYTFSDGTPFADKETQSWIQGLGSAVQANSSEIEVAGVPVQSFQENDSEKGEIIHRAKQMVKDKKLQGGVALLQEYSRKSESMKDKFLWQIEIAHLLIHSKNDRVAVPIIKNLVETIEIFRLHEWDPDLSMQGLLLAWSSLRDKKTYREEAEKIFGLMARIDPAKTLLLKS